MSRPATDAAVGMMDAAYFTSRKELLDFFNDLLDLNLTKIEQTASGAVACQLTEYIFPGSIPMQKVNWEAKSDYEFVQNYKLLQSAFTKHNIQRYVDVDKLIRAKYQDNLEFCQWLKAFYDQTGRFREDYDPAAVRGKGKGGAKYNQILAMGGKSTSTNKGTRPRPTGMAPRPTTTANATATTTRSTAPSSLVARASRPVPERMPDEARKVVSQPKETSSETAGSTSETLAKEKEILMAEVRELNSKIADLELAVVDTEQERDFYFQKLRSVEVILQVHQEKGADSDPLLLVDKIFQILYATAEDNVVVNDEGEVVKELEGEPEMADTVEYN